MISIYTNKYDIKIFKREFYDKIYSSLFLHTKNMTIQINSGGILLYVHNNDMIIHYHIAGNVDLHDLFSERSITIWYDFKLLRKIYWTVHNKKRSVYKIQFEDAHNVINISENGDVVFNNNDTAKFNLDDEKR